MAGDWIIDMLRHRGLALVAIVFSIAAWFFFRPLGSRQVEAHGTNKRRQAATTFDYDLSPVAGEHTRSKLQHQKNGKSREIATSASADEKLAIITKAAYSVVEKLRVDEASRAKLIRSENLTDKKNYTYEIQRRENFEEFLNNVYSTTASKLDISRIALKTMSSEKISDFDIPSGSVRIVKIQIPFDAAKEMTYTSMVLKPGSPEGQIDLKNTTIGRVPVKSSGWRYDMLIDANGK